MAEKTCAACDCNLDANSIKVKISGKTVEVCCDECARKLKEAHASAAAPSEGPDMDGDKMAASAHDEQRRITRPGAALDTGAGGHEPASDGVRPDVEPGAGCVRRR